MSVVAMLCASEMQSPPLATNPKTSD